MSVLEVWDEVRRRKYLWPGFYFKNTSAKKKKEEDEEQVKNCGKVLEKNC